MALTLRPGAEQHDPLGDDYLIEGEGPAERSRAGLQIVRGVQAVLVVVLALLSLTMFWMIGLMLGVF
jgi:hypothetical protein